MSFVEYPIAARGDAPQSVGNLGCFRSRPLANVVEAIWDCEIPDAEFARTLTIKCAPSTSLWLMGHYRAPAAAVKRLKLTVDLLMKCALVVVVDLGASCGRKPTVGSAESHERGTEESPM